jgi:hypothetical protein
VQNLCVGQSVPKPPPTTAEQEQANLEDWAHQRAEFGSSRASRATYSAPLGDRPVVDAYNRKTLQQLGSRPGQPPCPAKPAEPTALEQAVAQRAGYGMRADPGYVQSRLNRHALYSKAEARWVSLRPRRWFSGFTLADIGI